jgi:phosphate:Na+ symporter
MLWQANPHARADVVNFHVAFNLALVVAFVGLLDPAARLLAMALPGRQRKANLMAEPLYLEQAMLDTSYLALTNASREALRMGDRVDSMLRLLLQAITANDLVALQQLARDGKVLDRLQEALKAYLTQLGTDGLSDTDATRHSHILDFAVNLGHAGDIIEHGLADAASRKLKRGIVLHSEDEADLRSFHACVLEHLKLAMASLMTGDRRSAQSLLDAKRHLNAMERTVGRRHLNRLEARQKTDLESSTLYLAILRDLRRVNSHLSAVAYDILGLAHGREAADESLAREKEPVAEIGTIGADETTPPA